VSPTDARAALLHAECTRDWAAIKTHMSRATSTESSRGDAEAALVALSLDHAYQAFETILLRLERAVGLPERTGRSWHTALLADAAIAVTGLRPAVFPPESLADWDAVLRFRHFLRHAYVITLDAEKLKSNLVRLQRAVTATEPWFEAVLAAIVTP
jgi:hypothetical protein